jgi:hypothetical protein
MILVWEPCLERITDSEIPTDSQHDYHRGLLREANPRGGDTPHHYHYVTGQDGSRTLIRHEEEGTT